MMNAKTFRELADKANANTRLEKDKKLNEYVQKSLMPKIEKYARQGAYRVIISPPTSLGLPEVAQKLESMGFAVTSDLYKYALRVEW